MIDSESVSVEAYYIDDEQNWVLNKHEEISDVLTLASMGFDVPLADIYEYVRFNKEKWVVDKIEKRELKIANYQLNHFFSFFFP